MTDEERDNVIWLFPRPGRTCILCHGSQVVGHDDEMEECPACATPDPVPQNGVAL